MGHELGTTFFAMYKELVLTSKKWEEYNDLFLTKSSRMELINRSAPLFFSIFEDSIINDILLSISRLTDPPITAGFKNASLKRALSLIKEETTKQDLTKELNFLDQKVSTIRELRNKNISHIDFDNLFNQGPKPVIEVTKKDIEESIKMAQIIFNSIEYHFCKSKTVFESFPSMGGSYELLRLIDLGLELEGLNEQKLRNGQNR
jgi:hypothetical protein